MTFNVTADLGAVVVNLLTIDREPSDYSLLRTLNDFFFRSRPHGCLFYEDDEAFKVPELRAFCEFARYVHQSRVSDSFGLLDYWLPPSYINAIYLMLSREPEISAFPARLQTLYDTPPLQRRIFDTNKIIQVARRYSPFVLSSTPRSLSDVVYEGYYVDLAQITALLNEQAGAAMDELHRAEGAAFIPALNGLYDICHANRDHPNVEPAIRRACSDLVSNVVISRDLRVGDVQFEDVQSAFLTYAAFFSRIVPSTAKEYVYFPARMVTAPESKLRWVGGILLPFARNTDAAERTAFEHACQAIVSSFYGGYSDSLLLETLRRAAQAQIMSRNMSHNIGSHALARIRSDVIARSPKDTERLLAYLQERMDFIARVATEWPSWREPVLFGGDLLHGFFRQGLLLDHLIADDGYSGKDIEFAVKLPQRGGTSLLTYRWVADAGTEDQPFSEYRRTSPEGPGDDILVAIPGGPVGRQAFYGLVENAIRNAAKHNPGRDTVRIAFELSTDSASDDPLFRVRYQDSLTLIRPESDVVGKIQSHLQRDLLDTKTRRPVEHGWGIQEMKVYADYLAHGVAVSKNATQPATLTAAEAPFEDRAAGLPANVLTLEFGLHKPRLAAIMGSAAGTAGFTSRPASGLAILQFKADTSLLRDLVRMSPGLLYIMLDEEPLPLMRWLNEHDLALPARVLLRPHPAMPAERLRAQLAEYGLLQRVRIDTDAAPPEGAEDDGTDLAAQRAIIDLYRRWLVAIAAERGFDLPYKVVVYFDRPVREIAERWANLQTSISLHSISRLIDVYPMFRAEADRMPNHPVTLDQPWVPIARGFDRTTGRVDELHALDPGGTWIVYDNHRHGMPENIEPSFYQHVGGAVTGSSNPGPLPNNREVFDRLTNVADGFAGVMFLISLVESSLLRVLVLDERVAGNVLQVLAGDGSDESVLEWKTADTVTYGGHLLDMAAEAGVFIVPFLNFVQGRDLQRISVVRALGPVIWEHEENEPSGLTIAGNEVRRCVTITLKGSREVRISTEHGPEFDFMVIHVSLLEAIAGVVTGFDQDAFLASLRGIAARVILTSGRGAQLSGVTGKYPFVEFAAIENYLVREIAKPSLGNVLLAVCGQRIADDTEGDHLRH